MIATTKQVRRPLVRLTDEQLDGVFERAEDQGDALIGIYKLVLPDWDDISSISGHPSCNEKTWKDICQRFFKLDAAKHPECLAGGLWLNRGFSTSHGETLADGVVSLKGCTITLKENTR